LNLVLCHLTDTTQFDSTHHAPGVDTSDGRRAGSPLIDFAPPIPHTSAVSGPGHTARGGGHSTTGKIERAVGTMIGSKSLKAKGMQKEQEANSLKLQGQELAEAERLEREAMMRRDRAVAHGISNY
jgi:hypothetical protein